MKYRMIECGEPSALETEVNAAIGEGWIPLGGVCVAMVQVESYREGTNYFDTVYTYAQAMVKQ